MSLNETFNNAAKIVLELNEKPSNEDLLCLYKYYKQSIIGDINIPEPSFFRVECRTKWDAWNSVKGLTQEQAKINYIKLVAKLVESQ